MRSGRGEPARQGGRRRDGAEPHRSRQARQQAPCRGRPPRHSPAVLLTAANVHDSSVLEEVLDRVPPIRQPRGRPRRRPAKLHTDKAYDYPRCRRACRRRGIIPRIARRGIESSERLGRHRWVVERTLSWIARFRRLIIRYERRDDIHLAFLTLACGVVCFRFLQRFC